MATAVSARPARPAEAPRQVQPPVMLSGFSRQVREPEALPLDPERTTPPGPQSE